MLSLLISLLPSFLIGWVSQRSGMCLVKAVGLLLNRRPTLFVSLIACHAYVIRAQQHHFLWSVGND